MLVGSENSDGRGRRTLVERVDDVLRVVLNDIGRSKDRNPVAVSLRGLYPVHLRKEGQKGLGFSFVLRRP